MTREGWSTSTYEVLTNSGKRWVIDMSSSKRSEAMDYAEKLLNSAKYDGVRVTEMRDDWVREKVLFERFESGREKPLKIDPVPEATFCNTLEAYYELPARLTMGRILRAYLDRNTLTMLELLYHPGHLRALDRMDTFFPSAMQHGAQLQVKLTGQSKIERMDKLQTVFDKILNYARKNDASAHYAQILAAHGMERAIADIEAEIGDKKQRRAIYGMLADTLEGRGWREKLTIAIGMAETATEQRAVAFADELIAELLDGVVAVQDIFGGFATPIEAWKTYMLIVSGRFDKVPKYMSPDLVRLSGLFAEHDLEATRMVLMRRIAKGLGSTQALSKEGRNEDRNSFIGLVRDLIEPTGISGGPSMVEAVVLRAKTLLGEDGADLPTETAIRQALYLMPSQAARLGVLLDLTGSELGQKHDLTIRQQLLHLLNELRSIYDLFPPDVNDEERVRGVDALRERLGMSTLQDDIKDTLSTSLVNIANGGGQILPSDVKKSNADTTPRTKKRHAVQDGELVLAKDDVLFEEGEEGTEAYLIADGVLEVYRTHNGKKQHLAMLSKGEIIGEMSLIDHQPRMASAIAMVDTKLVVISDANLQGRLTKLAKDDQVLHFLLKTMVRRLRGLARITE